MKARTPKRPKGPPRYVPTLTEVVPEELLVVHSEPGTERAETGVEAQTVLPGSHAATPDKAQSPDLTAADVLQKSPQPAAVQEPALALGDVAVDAGLLGKGLSPAHAPLTQAVAVPSGRTGVPRQWSPDLMEDAVMHRVMQRVDIGLDHRIREAIATVVLEQTRSLLPRLREEVESVVRQVVCEAMAEELANDAIGKFLKT